MVIKSFCPPPHRPRQTTTTASLIGHPPISVLPIHFLMTLCVLQVGGFGCCRLVDDKCYCNENLMVLHGIRRSLGVHRLQPSMGIKRKEKRNVPASFPGGGGRYFDMKEDMRLALAASWDCRMLFRSGNHIIKYLQATHWRCSPPPQQILSFSLFYVRVAEKQIALTVIPFRRKIHVNIN